MVETNIYTNLRDCDGSMNMCANLNLQWSEIKIFESQETLKVSQHTKKDLVKIKKIYSEKFVGKKNWSNF
jgi:hypothetical protein